MKKQMIRLFGLAMALAVTVVLLSATALAANATEVIVAQKNVVNGNATTYWISDGAGGIKSEGASEENYTVKYVPSSNTLYLKDAKLAKSDANGTATFGDVTLSTQTVIYANGDLNVQLEGSENTVTGVNTTGNEHSIGIYVTGKLSLKGSGQLNVTGGAAAGADNTTYSIAVLAESVEIAGVSVNAEGGSCQKGASIGIRARHITIKNNATVKAAGGPNEGSWGSHGIALASYTKNESDSDPNKRTSNLTIEHGSTLYAYGGNAKSVSSGIYGDGNGYQPDIFDPDPSSEKNHYIFSINGSGTLYAVGQTSKTAVRSYGVYMDNNSLGKLDSNLSGFAAGITGGQNMVDYATSYKFFTADLSGIDLSLPGSVDNTEYLRSAPDFSSVGSNLNLQKNVVFSNIGNGGLAVWRYSAESATTPHELVLSEVVLDAGLKLPANTKLIVKGPSQTSSPIWGVGALSVTVNENSELNVSGSDCDAADQYSSAILSETGKLTLQVNGNLIADCGKISIGSNTTNSAGIQAKNGDLDITIGTNGSLKATGGKSASPAHGLSASGKVTINNNGKLTAWGSVFEDGNSQKVFGGNGIYAGNEVDIDNGINLLAGKYGIETQGATDIANATGGFVAGSDSPIQASSENLTLHKIRNNLADIDPTSIGNVTVDSNDKSSGLDLEDVNSPVFYSKVGGAGQNALWLPKSGEIGENYLYLTGVSTGQLTLPEGGNVIVFNEANTITGGVTMSAGTNNTLDLKSCNSSSLKVTNSDGVPFNGVEYVGLHAPLEDQILTAKAGSEEQDAVGIPGSVFYKYGGGYIPRDTDRYFEMTSLSGSLSTGEVLLTVENGFGGGVYQTGNVVPIKFDYYNSNGYFVEWKLESGDAVIESSGSQNTTVRMGSGNSVISCEVSESPLVPPLDIYNLTYSANYPNAPGDIFDGSYPAGQRLTARPGDIFPAPENMVFAGWSRTPAGDGVYQPGTTFRMPAGNVTLYAVWRKPGPALNKADHNAYMIGRPNNMMAPEENITREEVAMIFYRLLDDESKRLYETDDCGFLDVEPGRWSRRAVATLYNAGVILGAAEDYFDPERPITRAEFAVISSRFASDPYDGPNLFPDIQGHWAAQDINRAAKYGWITGMPGGNFEPDRYILRAEAAALINRVLERAPETKDDLLPGMRTWPDNMDETRWYYLDIQEAGNSHDYDRKEDGVHETWTALSN